jgi:hypothetical protein
MLMISVVTDNFRDEVQQMMADVHTAAAAAAAAAASSDDDR